MTDGNQNITTCATTTTTSTLRHQVHTPQPSQQHTMVVAVPPPTVRIPFPPVPPQRQLSPQYMTAHPYDVQDPQSHAGYFQTVEYGSFVFPSPPTETESSYSLPSSSSFGGPRLPIQPPELSSLTRYMPSAEQPLVHPSGMVHTPLQTHTSSQEQFLQQMQPPFPADTQYLQLALEPSGMHSVPVYPAPSPAQPVHSVGYSEPQLQLQESHTQKSSVIHVQEKPYFQELPISQSARHQWREQEIGALDVELARLSHKIKRIKSRMQQVEQEKTKLAYEQQVEQEQLYQHQQLLIQESVWLQQQRMQFHSLWPVPSGSDYSAPQPTLQLPQQNILFPSPYQQVGLHPPQTQRSVAPQYSELVPPTVKGLGHQGFSHQRGKPSSSKLQIPEFYPEPSFTSRSYAHLTEVTDFQQPRSTEALEPSTSTAAASATTAAPAHRLRPDVAAFRPSDVPRGLHRRRPHERERSSRYRSQLHQPGTRNVPLSRQAASPILQDVRKKLRNYALETMVPSSDGDEESKLEVVKRTVMRVPAVCFNEQKFLDKEDYQVLVQPQSPAVRGQEALARVCFVLERALHLRGMGATIISDYKFKENYLKRAPQDVLSVLNRPEDEGSHNILMIGPQIGIVCIQVTCVEESTNSSTVKKQVRDTLRQLKKDEKVLKHVLEDMDLDADCIHLVMALPNVTTDQLKRKLEMKYLKILSSALDTTDDLEDLLTLDHLPSVGHHHWLSRESRGQLWGWLDRLAGGSAELSVENYLQIFARYTCGWSVPEVWSISKPRVLVRSWAHAVAETYHRYHLPVLTPQQDSVLHMAHPLVAIKAFAGTGHTCLLQVKAIMELRQGHAVLVFVPQNFTSLRKDYEQLANSNAQYQGSMYIWSDEASTAESSQCSFQTVDGTSKTLEDLTENHQEIFALFEYTNHDDSLLRLFGEVKDKVTSVWITFDAAAKQIDELLSKVQDSYFPVQLLTMTRLPSITQVLLNHPGLEGATAETLTSRTSTQLQSVSLTTMRSPEVSSYQGLPTDGPFPLFIWHPVTAPGSTESAILSCQLCMNRFRSALQSLVPELRPGTNMAEDETASATRRAEQVCPATEHSDLRETIAGNTDVSDEDSDSKSGSGDTSIHVDSGNVPRPLTMDDVVLFVDTREHIDVLKEVLDLVNCESSICPLEDLPHLMGSEKAIVGFVGRVNVQATDTVLQALVSQLRGIMSLCQSQLIVAVEVNYDLTGAEATRHRQQWEPFQPDIDDMLRESWREHNL